MQALDAMTLVYDAIDEVNELQSVDAQVPKAPGTALFGKHGALDSLGLVTLISGLEARLETATGVPLTLTDERALSIQPSVFRTIASLAEYVSILVREVQR